MSADVSVMKPYKGLGMEGVVAKWYASLTSKAMDDFQALARRMADRIPSDCIVLDGLRGLAIKALKAVPEDEGGVGI